MMMPLPNNQYASNHANPKQTQCRRATLSLGRQVGFSVALNGDPLPQLILSLHVPSRHEAVAMLALEKPSGQKSPIPIPVPKLPFASLKSWFLSEYRFTRKNRIK